MAESGHHEARDVPSAVKQPLYASKAVADLKDGAFRHLSSLEKATPHAENKTKNTPFRLISLKTQALYWIVSAGAATLSHYIPRTLPNHALTPPTLLLSLAALTLVAIELSHRPTRPWWGVRLYFIPIASLSMLAGTEMEWILQQMDIWTHPSPRPMWSLRQQLAIKFCLAYFTISSLRRLRKHEHTKAERYTTQWCMPLYSLEIGDQWLWERNDKLRGACHAALGICIANSLGRLVAHFLDVKMGLYNMPVWWGTGCLGNTNLGFQMVVLLRPVHDFTFWLCEQILRYLTHAPVTSFFCAQDEQECPIEDDIGPERLPARLSRGID